MAWNELSVKELVESQRAFFGRGQTLDVEWRVQQLKRLKGALLTHEDELVQALVDDLGRSPAEAFLLDIGPTLAELNEAIRHVRRWARPETRFSGLKCFPSTTTRVYKMPYGVTLIISPFNFPMFLSLGPLVASIAAGNTAIVKTSSKAPHCTRALRCMLEDAFAPEYVSVVEGGHDVADVCLAQRLDKIFYTGSPRVAVHVLEMAAKRLTPVALELGGETGNWCIVRKDANLADAARKLAFFKMANAGQVCIDVNQVAVAREVADEFVELLTAAMKRQIGPDARANPEYPHLISAEAYRRCAEEAEAYRDRIVHGGRGDAATLRFEPTVIYPVGIEEPIVQHELFNPLLPVVPFDDGRVDALLDIIAQRERGLALYVFTRDMAWARRTMTRQQYGGGCVNEVCMHLLVRGAPFNGVGHSGMGSYHGEWGFREFTHPSTVLYGRTHMNLPLREHPYSGVGAYKLPLIKLLLR